MAEKVGNNENAIWVSVGVTKNLGNYESLKLDAGARYTADPSDVDEWEKVWKIVEDQIEKKMSEANEELNE